MVRIIGQGFSTPRSRHSSGEEMIDRFAAMKALSALDDDIKHSEKDGFVTKPLVIDCNNDTNDSFSGVDSEEDGAYGISKDLQNNNTIYQDPVVNKKERRRERNKLSAQNYRQRRRQQYAAAQKTLESLEEHHKELLEKVTHLEAEKHIVEEYLKNCVRIPWCPYHQPASPPGPMNCTNTNPSTMDTIRSSEESSSATSSPSPSCSTTPTPQLHLDNFRVRAEELAPLPEEMRPINMVMEKNNNMPLCMPGVALTTEESSVS